MLVSGHLQYEYSSTSTGKLLLGTRLNLFLFPNNIVVLPSGANDTVRKDTMFNGEHSVQSPVLKTSGPKFTETLFQPVSFLGGELGVKKKHRTTVQVRVKFNYTSLLR